MVHIKVKKGLDIPISGRPEGRAKPLVPGGEVSPLVIPHFVSLNVSEFDDVKFRLLVREGDSVKIGQPLAEDKSSPGRFFVAPAAGVIKEIRRGLKRRLLDVVIEVAPTEEYVTFSHLNLQTVSKEDLLARLMEAGIFAKIHVRPFNFLANPQHVPRSIFVKAVESAPFVPPAELQVIGHEKDFQTGLQALTKLTPGKVHLVYRHDTYCKAFTEAENVEKHTVEGPHPVSNVSLHIQKIDPIKSAEDVIWTLNAHDVVCLGHLLNTGKIHNERVISIAGPGVLEDRVGYFKAREGYPISALVAGRIGKGLQRLISGDPLMGHRVQVEDFLGFDDYVFCVVPENTEREFVHFMGLGLNKYTFSRAYLSGHFRNPEREYAMTTNMHGEHRAFIDNTLYDKVMPLDISTMHLVKAVMAEDLDLAQYYGLLEVDPEDFALPTFVDPSKIEMVDIIRQGLRRHAKEVLH